MVASVTPLDQHEQSPPWQIGPLTLVPPAPYADSALALQRSGLGGPLPLPSLQKSPPPTGWTGAGAHYPSGADVAAWTEDTPAANVGLRLAEGVVGIDVDAYGDKEGASTLAAAEAVLGALPPTFMSTSRHDGVSGIRLFRVPAGTVLVSTLGAAGYGPHVEMVQPAHRYVVAPPSIHPGGREYRWVGPDGVDLLPGEVPSVDDLPELPPAWVAGLAVDAERADVGREVLAPLDTWPTATTTDPYVVQVCAGIGTDTPRGDWHAWTFSTACRLAAAARLGLITRTDLDASHLVVVARLRTARSSRSSSEEPEREAARCWRDAVERTARMTTEQACASLGIRGGPAPTTASPTTEETTVGDAEPQQEQPDRATAVVAYVHERFTLMVTPAGEPYAVPRTGPRLPLALGERGGRLRDTVTAGLFERDHKVPASKAVDDALRVVVAQARGSAVATPLHLRVAPLGDGVVIDLGRPASGACIHVTPTGWAVLQNPPAEVLFRRTSATRPLPTPTRGGSLEPLRALLGFETTDDRWLLLRGWLVTTVLPDIARPMPFLIGSPGSAKSTRARCLLSVLEPTDELGSAFGRNGSDDVVRAASRYLIGFDNLTGSMSDAAQDFLCRLVSGESAEKRTLYSDGDLTSISYRRTGALTAVALPLTRPDTLERVIPIRLERLNSGQRRGESEVRTAFETSHPVVLGGLCDAAVSMLAALPAARDAVRPRPRWGDYADALAAYDGACAGAYDRSVNSAMADLAEDDPFVNAVREWLTSTGGMFEGEATVGWKGAARFAELAEGLPTAGPWWPRSAARFTAELEANTEPLRAVGVTLQRKRVKGRRLLVLTLASASGAGGEG